SIFPCRLHAIRMIYSIYMPFFKLHGCLLRSDSRITYFCMLIGLSSLAAIFKLNGIESAYFNKRDN
ncbi:MAG: hypothetical protein LBE52_08785, partial [Providencia sp.]|nr:hypothetical protein [Providencia sp.]